MSNSSKYFLLSSIFLIFLNTSFAQLNEIEGRILDVNTLRPIVGVNIYIEGSKIGTYSDVSGKFNLSLTNLNKTAVIIFQHIGYDTIHKSISKIISEYEVLMQSRLIQMNAIEVEAVADVMHIKKDLPQPISVIESKQFDIKGYVDAGDLLRTDYSVQVDEELSGKKTISMRGGNPDEVIILYNGIKMNNTYDNVFDLSLIDLSDIERFEIIKGSNTSLYGPEAFSGVVNIVPKYKQDYTIRFQQRFGTYASGNWGLHLYQKFKRLYGNFSYKQGGSTRSIASENKNDSSLQNKSENFTGNITYHFSETDENNPITSLNLMYVRTQLDYLNDSVNESLLNFNQLVSSRFYNETYDLSISSAFQWLDEIQDLLSNSYSLEREIDNRSFYVNVEKSLNVKLFEILFSYQFKNSELKYNEDRSDLNEIPFGIEKAKFNRFHHGVATVIKFKAPSQSKNIHFIDFDLSFRYDNIIDKQTDSQLRDSTLAVEEYSFNTFDNNKWNKYTTKFSTHLGGGNETFAFNAYMNIGTNIKFPSLYQQISVPQAIDSLSYNSPNLKPEKNYSLELGLVLLREIRENEGIFGWQINANYFKNSYDNKFRSYLIPGFPVTFYDNVKVASISGVELKPVIYLLNKKITAELGISKFFISEKAAFPFKYDFKRTINVQLDHEGYSFQIFWFSESEQLGWIRNSESRLSEITLPEYSNLDLHFNKFFEFYGFKAFFNFSARNILDDDFKLNGISIRDRRYYVTFGLQY
jgi:outer membrane cobalamin receptor